MKKGLKLFATGFICMSALAWNVKADEITTEAELNTCVAKESATCTITKEFEITKSIYIKTGKDIIVDLNGKKVIAPDDGKANWYGFIVDGGKLTLKDSSDAQTGELWAKCYGIETKTGTFVMESGKITATNNKTLGAAIVNYGGKVEVKGGSLASASNWAVNAQSYFSDSELVISGGTFEVTAEDTATVQIGGEYTKTKETVTITGGTFKGKTAFAVSEDANATISITGGEFSSDISEFLSTESESKSYEINTEDGTKFVVATEDDVVSAPYEPTEAMDAKDLEEALAELEKSEEAEGKELAAAIKKALEGKATISMHSIFYGKFLGEDLIVGEEENQPKEGEKVAVTLNVPETLEKVKAGFNRKYSVIRVHFNSDTDKFEVDVLEAKENEDGTITFETDKFSDYILTYEDVKADTNPDTFDGILLYMIIASVSVIGLISLFGYAKKAKNY